MHLKSSLVIVSAEYPAEENTIEKNASNAAPGIGIRYVSCTGQQTLSNRSQRDASHANLLCITLGFVSVVSLAHAALKITTTN